MKPSGAASVNNRRPRSLNALLRLIKYGLARPLMLKTQSIYFEITPHHRNTFPTDPHPGNPTISFLEAASSRAAHVYALRDSQLQRQITLAARASQRQPITEVISSDTNVNLACDFDTDVMDRGRFVCPDNT